MKHWDHLTAEERQERLGDASIDRSRQTSERAAELVRRLEAGLPMSLEDKRTARRLIREGV